MTPIHPSLLPIHAPDLLTLVRLSTLESRNWDGDTWT
jgi:hypothetical protein